MNVYEQIQNLDPGTEVTVTLRGIVRDWGDDHVFEVGDSHRFTTSLTHAESITVHEAPIAWRKGDVVQGASGVTFVRGLDGQWRFASGSTTALVTDKNAHTYTPVIREGEIVAKAGPDHD